MSQPAVTALAPQTLDFEIVYDDGEPLETEWHYVQISLLRELLSQLRAEQQRRNAYIGTNQFVYYSVEQAREISELVAKGGEPKFRGPDVFWVNDAPPKNERPAWIAWEEGGRLPDVIFELLSKSNKLRHRKEKKDLYAQVFRTSEYFLFGPPHFALEGFRLSGGVYRPLAPGAEGRLWSEQLRSFVGLWEGVREGVATTWVRLYRPDGSPIPTKDEVNEAAERRAEEERQRAEAADRRAEEERQRAEEERQRAEAAEAELARLRALLARQT